MEYFGTYKLMSSKYLDYINWVKVDALIAQKNLKVCYARIIELKQNMNVNRTKFTWYHLRSFKFIKPKNHGHEEPYDGKLSRTVLN